MLEFLSKDKGTGGEIKTFYKDFIVEELSYDNHRCKVEYFLEGPAENPSLKIPENPNNFDYLLFDLEKYNTELNFALKKISAFCGVSRKRIHYAGLKDKRAITCQRVSFYKPPERLSSFSSKTLCLKNPVWSQNQIDLGMLKGNFFKIKIRNVEYFPPALPSSFPNYFGSQRFGGVRQITHKVGKEFLKGNFKDAVLLYLTHTNEKEHEDIKQARQNLKETLDFKKALKEFPKKYRFERAILNHLSSHPSDFIGAFRSLPKAIRYLFVHAYQAHLFNQILSLRLKKYSSLEPIEGDILEDNVPVIPLFGFNSSFSKGEAGKLEKEVLKKEGISLLDFKVSSFPELSSKGSYRKIKAEARELSFDLNKDEKILSLSFFLEKGTYATSYLREVMKKDI